MVVFHYQAHVRAHGTKETPALTGTSILIITPSRPNSQSWKARLKKFSVRTKRPSRALAFREVRDAIEVTDSALSKQIAILERVAYVKIGKAFVGKMPRTSLTLTKTDRAAWTAHLAALNEIAGSKSD